MCRCYIWTSSVSTALQRALCPNGDATYVESYYEMCCGNSSGFRGLFFFKKKLRFVNDYAFIAISAKSNIRIPEVSRYHAVFKKSRLLKSKFKGPVQQPKHTANKLIPEFSFLALCSRPSHLMSVNVTHVSSLLLLQTNLLQCMIRNCVNRTAF